MSEVSALLKRPIDIETQTVAGIAALEGFLSAEASEPRAILAPQLEIDENIKQQFGVRFLGVIGVERTVEIQRSDGMTLATAITRAGEGDRNANSIVEANIATTVAEGLFKDGYISTVRKGIGADGTIQQFGLSLHQVHYNSYTLRSGRHEKLRQFTLAEALNGYREQAYRDAGLLDDYFMLVASCVPEDLPEDTLDYRGEGFFTRTMTYTLQSTTCEAGEIITETVFRRGTTADEDAIYSMRQAQRLDLQVIGMIYEWLGFDPPRTALEFLQRPLLLKRSEFPNGVLDILRRCDIAADVLQDKIADRSEECYAGIRLESSLKDASLQSMKSAVKHDLLAAAGTFARHEDANRLLWDLVRQHAVRDSLTNEFIEPAVFGATAAPIIEGARQAYLSGDQSLANQLLEKAQEVSNMSGCGGGSCGIEELFGPELSEAKSLLGASSNEKIAKDTERPCPECGKKSVVYAWTESEVKKACTNCKVKGGAKAKPTTQKSERSLLALAA